MLYPSINELVEKIDSRYTLVMITAKRARQLIDGDKPQIETDSIKPVSIAIEEFDQNQLYYKRRETKGDG
ncbi:MAG TPA: DNA-directed RNA polymerase subunit omega [Tissierellales bacterium]|nr:DNA-directed RNA polymerase subunit omega [Tissierellales bacterium]